MQTEPKYKTIASRFNAIVSQHLSTTHYELSPGNARLLATVFLTMFDDAKTDADKQGLTKELLDLTVAELRRMRSDSVADHAPGRAQGVLGPFVEALASPAIGIYLPSDAAQQLTEKTAALTAQADKFERDLQGTNVNPDLAIRELDRAAKLGNELADKARKFADAGLMMKAGLVPMGNGTVMKI